MCIAFGLGDSVYKGTFRKTRFVLCVFFCFFWLRQLFKIMGTEFVFFFGSGKNSVFRFSARWILENMCCDTAFSHVPCKPQFLRRRNYAWPPCVLKLYEGEARGRGAARTQGRSATTWIILRLVRETRLCKTAGQWRIIRGGRWSFHENLELLRLYP